MSRSRQYDSTSSSSSTGLGSSSKGLASGLLDIGFSTGFPASRQPAGWPAKVASCLWLINLGAITSASAWAAPPTQPADARGSIALYCADECGDLKLDGLALRTRLPHAATAPTVVITDVTDSWTRPDNQTLAQWGEGEVGDMGAAGQVVLIAWATPRNQAALTLARVLQVAVDAGPWVEDVDTGRLLGRVPTQQVSAEAMQDAPDVARLATIDIHDIDDGTTTLSTRGLVRLGLPDIVERGVSSSDSQTEAARLNAVAQALFETGVVSRLAVDATNFRSATAAAAACQLQGTAILSYDHGDKALLGPGPRASLDGFEGDFGTCPQDAATPTAAPTARTAGATPTQTPAQAPAQTLATVRTRAIRHLRGPVHDAWVAGLQPGERLLVKAPFQTTDGEVEWLWLEVSEWNTPKRLIGKLVSKPEGSISVVPGDTVSAQLGLVFDYLWVHADGSQEGNETQAWL